MTDSCRAKQARRYLYLHFHSYSGKNMKKAAVDDDVLVVGAAAAACSHHPEFAEERLR
jgi:hypothetical protein